MIVVMDEGDKKAVVSKLAKGAGKEYSPPEKDDPGADKMARKEMAMEDFMSAGDAKGKTDALLAFLRACGVYSG